jgi:acyl-ACP thioesterase
MKDIMRETVPIRFGSVDRSDRLTLGAVFGFFQEAAITHAEDLGVGRDALAEIGQAWVLSRIAVFMEKRPRYGDTVTVESWPRSWEKLFALRDYAIKDASGRPLVRGRGSWLILDVEKRRPLRVQQVIEKLPPNHGINAMTAGAPALSFGAELVKTGERRAAYSDIDFYGHVNNARYIQWIQDMVEPELMDTADQIRLDINYVSEVLPGETVELWSAPIDKGRPAESPPPEAGSWAEYPGSVSAAFACEGRKAGQAVFRAELRLGA